jgi:hypothetical protein
MAVHLAYISNELFSKLQHLASYVSRHYAMAFDRQWPPKKFVQGRLPLGQSGFIEYTPLEGQAAPPPW